MARRMRKARTTRVITTDDVREVRVGRFSSRSYAATLWDRCCAIPASYIHNMVGTSPCLRASTSGRCIDERNFCASRAGLSASLWHAPALVPYRLLLSICPRAVTRSFAGGATVVERGCLVDKTSTLLRMKVDFISRLAPKASWRVMPSWKVLCTVYFCSPGSCGVVRRLSGARVPPASLA
jgi:hypothetical protein